MCVVYQPCQYIFYLMFLFTCSFASVSLFNLPSLTLPSFSAYHHDYTTNKYTLINHPTCLSQTGSPSLPSLFLFSHTLATSLFSISLILYMYLYIPSMIILQSKSIPFLFSSLLVSFLFLFVYHSSTIYHKTIQTCLQVAMSIIIPPISNIVSHYLYFPLLPIPSSYYQPCVFLHLIPFCVSYIQFL